MALPTLCCSLPIFLIRYLLNVHVCPSVSMFQLENARPIVTKLDINVTSSIATPAIDNSNVSGARISEVWATLAPVSNCGNLVTTETKVTIIKAFKSSWKVQTLKCESRFPRGRERAWKLHVQLSNLVFSLWHTCSSHERLSFRLRNPYCWCSQENDLHEWHLTHCRDRKHWTDRQTDQRLLNVQLLFNWREIARYARYLAAQEGGGNWWGKYSPPQKNLTLSFSHSDSGNKHGISGKVVSPNCEMLSVSYFDAFL